METILSLPNACLFDLPRLNDQRFTKANLDGNRIMTLEPLPMTLKALSIASNYIGRWGFLHPFPSLEELDIHNNSLNLSEEDDLTACFPSLKKLNISQNRLRTTECFYDLPLDTLNVSRNRLSTLAGLPPTLKVLTADQCELTMVQSRIPQRLESISLCYNELRYAGLPLNWSAVLRELHLNHNQIERFPRKLPDSLEILSLNRNKLKFLPHDLPKSLKVLCVTSNQIQYVPKYTKRFQVFLVDDNCLTVLPDSTIAQVFSADKNWNLTKHKEAQIQIKKCWKRYVLTLRLRHYRRTKKTKEELMSVSMMPERWDQIDCIDPVWFRRHPSHSHTDHH